MAASATPASMSSLEAQAAAVDLVTALSSGLDAIPEDTAGEPAAKQLITLFTTFFQGLEPIVRAEPDTTTEAWEEEVQDLWYGCVAQMEDSIAPHFKDVTPDTAHALIELLLRVHALGVEAGLSSLDGVLADLAEQVPSAKRCVQAITSSAAGRVRAAISAAADAVVSLVPAGTEPAAVNAARMDVDAWLTKVADALSTGDVDFADAWTMGSTLKSRPGWATLADTAKLPRNDVRTKIMQQAAAAATGKPAACPGVPLAFWYDLLWPAPSS